MGLSATNNAFDAGAIVAATNNAANVSAAATIASINSGAQTAVISAETTIEKNEINQAGMFASVGEAVVQMGMALNNNLTSIVTNVTAALTSTYVAPNVKTNS